MGGEKLMESSAVSHLAICTRDMEKSLAFYPDILGMKMLFDGQPDPTEGGRLHNYQQARKSRQRVSARPRAGLQPHRAWGTLDALRKLGQRRRPEARARLAAAPWHQPSAPVGVAAREPGCDRAPVPALTARDLTSAKAMLAVTW